MSVQVLTEEQVKDLVNYLALSKYSNLHTADRRYRQVKKVRKLHLIHLHGMHKRSSSIDGYVCGPNIEFQYSMNQKGIADIIYHPNISVQKAEGYLRKMAKEIKSRVEAGHISYPVKRSQGMFYLQRWKNPDLTSAANNAVNQKVLSFRFVDTMKVWNLRVLQGR
jgi:hypothetical protein